jgi:hypothetical protein
VRLCPEGGKIKAGLCGSVTHALFRRPPLWRIDVEMLVRIVRQQSLLAQPLCLAAYRRAQAVQPFGYLRSRICRPQGNKFAEFLVGPTGHGGTSVMAAPAPGAMPTDSCDIILAITLSPRRLRLRAAREPTRTGQFINASYRIPRFCPVGDGADTAGGEICWGVFSAATSSASRFNSARFDETPS